MAATINPIAMSPWVSVWSASGLAKRTGTWTCPICMSASNASTASRHSTPRRGRRPGASFGAACLRDGRGLHRGRSGRGYWGSAVNRAGATASRARLDCSSRRDPLRKLTDACQGPSHCNKLCAAHWRCRWSATTEPTTTTTTTTTARARAGGAHMASSTAGPQTPSSQPARGRRVARCTLQGAHCRRRQTKRLSFVTTTKPGAGVEVEGARTRRSRHPGTCSRSPAGRQPDYVRL